MSGIDHTKVEELVRKCVPDIDEAIIQYIQSYLDDVPTSEEESNLSEFIGPMLLDAGGEQDAVDALCSQLAKLMPSQNATKGPVLERLEQPVQMIQQNAVSATAHLSVGNKDLEHVTGRKITSQVNTEKLKKAEARIRAKMQKRERDVAYQASKLIEKQAEPTFAAINPILDYTSTRGKSKDIRIEVGIYIFFKRDHFTYDDDDDCRILIFLLVVNVFLPMLILH
jgi:ATP-binding cassette subfamily F protein 3